MDDAEKEEIRSRILSLVPERKKIKYSETEKEKELLTDGPRNVSKVVENTDVETDSENILLRIDLGRIDVPRPSDSSRLTTPTTRVSSSRLITPTTRVYSQQQCHTSTSVLETAKSELYLTIVRKTDSDIPEKIPENNTSRFVGHFVPSNLDGDFHSKDSPDLANFYESDNIDLSSQFGSRVKLYSSDLMGHSDFIVSRTDGDLSKVSDFRKDNIKVDESNVSDNRPKLLLQRLTRSVIMLDRNAIYMTVLVIAHL